MSRRRLQLARLLVLGTLAAAAAVLACSDLRLEPAANDIAAPIADPSWKFQIYPVLQRTCASSGACHLAPADTNRPNLISDSIAYAQLVNVTAHNRPLLRVKPGFADSSFFYLVLLDSTSQRLGYAYRMPLTSYPLPFPTRETIKNWINKGAKNN